MLKTLEKVNQIGEFKISRGDIAGDDDYIHINDEKNTIRFKIQDGPIKESGLNGCQVTVMILVIKVMIEFFVRKDEKILEKMLDKIKNGSFNSNEESEKLRKEYDNIRTGYNYNKQTVLALAGALHQQELRTVDRSLRGVEGTSKP